MTKKIRVLLLAMFGILWVWVSFADIIRPNSHWEERCVKLQNIEIWEYRAIQTLGYYTGNDCHLADDRFFIDEIKENKCLEESDRILHMQSCIYLVDKTVDIKNITTDYIKENAIPLGEVKPGWHWVENTGFLSDVGNIEVTVYKIEKSDLSWENYYLDKVTTYSMWIWSVDAYTILEFLVLWVVTIIIETIVLFIISKFFRKEDNISNWKLLLIWTLASTITLPLLWAVLPIFIKDYTLYTIVWELLVIFIEIFIIKYWLKIWRWKAILASVICNLVSYVVWLLIF